MLFSPSFIACFAWFWAAFLYFFVYFYSVSDCKICFSIRESILTSERCAQQPFAGQNTQQKSKHFPKSWWPEKQSIILLNFFSALNNKTHSLYHFLIHCLRLIKKKMDIQPIHPHHLSFFCNCHIYSQLIKWLLGIICVRVN